MISRTFLIRFGFLCMLCGLIIYIALAERPLFYQVHLHRASIQNSEPTSWISLQYRPPIQDGGQKLAGVPFNNTVAFLSHIGFPITQTVVVTADNMGRFVFATGCNRRFLFAGLDAIATVQKQFPNHTIYFYDLSDGWIIKEHVSKIKQLCNVVYRKFDFSLYPHHVNNLWFYAWKPLIIHELLREHEGVFWFDTSIRFHSGVLHSIVRPAATNGGFLTYDSTGHSIYAATYHATFQYLPIAKPAAVKVSMYGAGIVLVYRTRFVYEEVVRWWVLCALVKDCIAPTTDIHCKFRGRDQYANCHRYDQSALNILLANAFVNNSSAYYNPNGGLTINRRSSGKERVFVCFNANGTLTGGPLEVLSSSHCRTEYLMYIFYGIIGVVVVLSIVCLTKVNQICHRPSRLKS